MLYRYPIEQKKTAQEITVGNRRYDTYTGEELPPIPYLTLGAAQNSGTAGITAAATKAAGGTGAYTGGATAQKKTATAAQQNAAAQQALLEQKRAALENQYAQNRSLMQQNYNMQKQTAQSSNEEALRQLYIAYMQGIKNIPQQTALQGAGGEIESLKMRHRTNYEDNRAKQNSDFGGILGEIQKNYNSDLMALEEKYLKQLMSL